MVDAKHAIDLDENMVKAYYRLIQAQLHLGRYKAAVMSARAGERLLNIKASRTTDFSMLLDQIAAAGALQGDYSAFDGRALQVTNSWQPTVLPPKQGAPSKSKLFELP